MASVDESATGGAAQVSSSKWDMSQERAFIENLFCQRFNFFIVIFSLVIAGAASANTQIKLFWILISGFILCSLVAITIYRIYVKLDDILKLLHNTPNHPVKISGNEARKHLIKNLPGQVNWIIGWLIPLLCCLALLYGSIQSYRGALVAVEPPATPCASQTPIAQR